MFSEANVTQRLAPALCKLLSIHSGNGTMYNVHVWMHEIRWSFINELYIYYVQTIREARHVSRTTSQLLCETELGVGVNIFYRIFPSPPHPPLDSVRLAYGKIRCCDTSAGKKGRFSKTSDPSPVRISTSRRAVFYFPLDICSRNVLPRRCTCYQNNFVFRFVPVRLPDFETSLCAAWLIGKSERANNCYSWNAGAGLL